MSGRAVNSMSDSGRPMWLFKFPRFRITRYAVPRNSAVTSFVVVFPALPVIATTFVIEALRVARASAWSARVVSSTSITTALRSTAAARPCGTTTPVAPASIAAAEKSAPSNRSPRIPKYNSAVRSVRVSIDTPENSVCSPPLAIAPPMAAATHSAVSRIFGAIVRLHDAGVRPPPSEQLARDRHVVARQVFVADDLVLLVSLARDQHHVARPRVLDRFGDRRPPIRNREQQRVVTLGVRRDAALNFVDDPLGILVTRIVRRDHEDVGQPARNRAHQRPFRAIAIAAATKQCDEATADQRPRGLEQIPQGVVGVRVVDDDGERVFRVRHDLEAPRHGLQRLNPSLDGVERQTEGDACAGGGEDVVDIRTSDEAG